MDPILLQDLHNLLVQCTGNDTNEIKAATARLNVEYFKLPAVITALASILGSDAAKAVRQLAAVEMRKRVSQKNGALWKQLAGSDRQQIKGDLLNLLFVEQDNLVRHSAARVVPAILSVETPQMWPELLPFLIEACISPSPTGREVGAFMLFTILETSIEAFEEQLSSILQLFSQLIVDPENVQVRVTTVRALGVIAQWITDDKHKVESLQRLIPSMITVLEQTLEEAKHENAQKPVWVDDAAKQLFDVFETLLILEVPLLGPYISTFVPFLLRYGSDKELDSDLRVLVLNALNWTVQYKKSKIQSQGLAGTILEGLMPITTESESEDSDEQTPCQSALQTIDALAKSLPPAQVFPALRELLQQYLSSSDPNFRRGAMLALGVVCEGCSEYMTPHLNDVWPMIESGLHDPDKSVRKATCVTVSFLCEWFEDECASKHPILIPAIMNLVTIPETQRSACTALDTLLEIMQDVIDQYLDTIMEKLASLLGSAPVPIKTVVVGAIGSAAHASKNKFLPYFKPTMNQLQYFLVLKGEGEESELRGITMDAVGTIAAVVGKDDFRPYFPAMMDQAFEGVEMGSSRLKECSFLFFSVMARLFGEEFVDYLPRVIPPLLESLRQAEGGEKSDVADAAAFTLGSSASSPITVLDTDNSGIDVELEDVDVDNFVEVNSAIAIEKEIAADTIGELFSATHSHFVPHMEECVLELQNLLSHYYEGIRKSATQSLLLIVRTFYELSGPQDWQPGVTSTVPLQSLVQKLVDHVLPPLLEMSNDDDKSVVASLCAELAETINKLGFAFVANHYEPICNIAKQVLERKALCQRDPDQDEDEEVLEDQAEYDSVLVSSAEDLVSALANALGSDFIQQFKLFYPLISQYSKLSRPVTDRSAAIGCLAEIIAGMKSAITPWTQPLMELFYDALTKDSEATVQSNACFATGLLIEHSETDLGPQYRALLLALHPFFDTTPSSSSVQLNAKDNAAGAVSRMIVRNLAAVPLDQVLPVLTAALPLKNDYEENRPVFQALFGIFLTNPQLLAPYWDHLLAVFKHVIDQPDQIDDGTRTNVLKMANCSKHETANSIFPSGA